MCIKFGSNCSAASHWSGGHLHEFVDENNRGYVARTPFDGEVIEGALDEAQALLQQVLPKPGAGLFYIYDYGDDWRHAIVLEEMLPANNEQVLPCCIAGQGAAPPDDVGGLPGYMDFLQAMADRSHSQHQKMVDWWGKDHFDPGAVDLAAINQRLAAVKNKPEPGVSGQNAAIGVDAFQGLSPADMHGLLYRPLDCPDVLQWGVSLRFAEAPMVAMIRELLNELAGKGVKLTAKGNLPGMLVRSMYQAGGGDAMRSPIEMGGAIRSEDDVAMVHLARVMANIVGWIKVAKGRLLLTRRGQKAQQGDNDGEVFMTLLRALFDSYNWAYLDRFEEVDGVRITAPFMLWLLARHGDQWLPDQFYIDAHLQAFPALINEFQGCDYVSPHQAAETTVRSRVFKLFRWFGLIECKRPESKERLRTSAYLAQDVRSTALFKDVVHLNPEF